MCPGLAQPLAMRSYMILSSLLTWPHNSSELLVLPQFFCGLPRNTEKMSLHTRVFLRQQETHMSMKFHSSPKNTTAIWLSWCQDGRDGWCCFLSEIQRASGTRSSPSDHPRVGDLKCVPCHQNSPKAVRANFQVNSCFLSQLSFTFPQIQGSLSSMGDGFSAGWCIILPKSFKWTHNIYYRCYTYIILTTLPWDEWQCHTFRHEWWMFLDSHIKK